jgi:hypothetical protein
MSGCLNTCVLLFLATDRGTAFQAVQATREIDESSVPKAPRRLHGLKTRATGREKHKLMVHPRLRMLTAKVCIH